MALHQIEEGPILLLGEGDFSFSVAYQPKIPDLCIYSTSFLSKDEVREVHKNAAKNISHLKEHGATILHSIDATKLQESPLSDKKFHRIIFNFPHIGGKSNIKKNRELLKNFFPSALSVLAPGGDVCVTLAQGQGGTPGDAARRQWHDTWQVVAAAAYADLVLSEMHRFRGEDYRDYSSTGFRSRDQHFYTKGAMTYIFTQNVPVKEPPSQALDIGKVASTLDSQSIVVDQHIARKLGRDLLSVPSHPIRLTADHFEQNLKGQRAGLQLSLENFQDISDQLPKILPGSHSTQQNGYSCGDKDDSKCLRTSLIDSFVAFTEHEDKIEASCMYLSKGEVFQKVGFDSESTPVQHEYCIFAKESANVTFDNFRSCVKDALEWSLVNTKVEAVEKEASDYPYPSDVTEFKVSYQSENQFYEVACNQVEARGPPELKKDIPKTKDYTRVIGYLGKLSKGQSVDENEHKSKKLKVNGGTVLICCLNLDSMAQIRYDIPDQRVFRSENPAFLAQFEGLSCSESLRFKPLSLFPPLWRHDVSVWENIGEDFDVQRFCDIVQDVTQGLVKCILCMNVWAEPQEGRISRCHRLLYQSSDVAISHARAHAFQNAVRLTVAKEMGVELR